MGRRVQVKLDAPADVVRDHTAAVLADPRPGRVTVGALDVELIPTESRGSVNGVLLVCGAAGSAAGLLLATLLEGPARGLGPAVARCGLAPLAAALLLLPHVPETATLGLDDISPTEG